jgi:L-lactate dehydrogenase complex protein LldG
MTTPGDGRETILAKIRLRLGAHDSAQRRATVAQRLANPHSPLVPERAKKQAEERRLQLRTFLEGQSATFIEVASAAEIPVAIGGFLRSTNLPLRVRVGDDAYLRGLAWQKEPALERRSGPAQGDDEVGLSHAAAAVAETGTLVMASGADNPVTLNYLPETQIVVVEDKAIVGGYEDAWQKIRASFGRRVMPRTVNFISGPSRTADIGGQLVMGAHGPRRLCVVLVRDQGVSGSKS